MKAPKKPDDSNEPMIKWLKETAHFEHETVNKWLVSQEIDGSDLGSKVEAGVEKGEEQFIKWADSVKLVGGPATKLFNALKPFVKGAC